MKRKTVHAQITRHDENLPRLARIEGQVRGVRRMIEEGAYCIDILTQIHAARAALQAVAERVLRKHVEGCVADAMARGRKSDVDEKIDEIVNVVKRSRG